MSSRKTRSIEHAIRLLKMSVECQNGMFDDIIADLEEIKKDQERKDDNTHPYVCYGPEMGQG